MDAFPQFARNGVDAECVDMLLGSRESLGDVAEVSHCYLPAISFLAQPLTYDPPNRRSAGIERLHR